MAKPQTLAQLGPPVQSGVSPYIRAICAIRGSSVTGPTDGDRPGQGSTADDADHADETDAAVPARLP